MKKFVLLQLAILFLGIVAIQAQTVNVTFRVDMQNETVPAEGVHLAGGFQSPLPWWDPAGIALTAPVFGAVWETTLQLTPGETIEYKFINGDSWGQDESVNGPCGAGNGNRVVTIPSTDTTLALVCFGSCNPCVVPQHAVIFQVDMSNETVSPDGVFVAGSFNGWDTDSTEMLPAGNNIYTATVQLDEGEYYEYKFLNGSQWETVPSACGTGGYSNRYLTVPGSDTTLAAVCFSSCDPCQSVTYVDVTFQVDMSETDSVSVDGVHIAGSFQGWDPSATAMTDNGNGIWSYTATLEAGLYYEYKFVNGTSWGADEQVPPDCNQNGNRYITVPSNDTTLTAVCFGSCAVCNPPVYDVTFTVDMSTQNVSPAGVHIAGTFNNWDPAGIQMTNTQGNYFQVTLSLGEGESHEFKYINGDTWDGAETVPGECNFNGNRYLTVPSSTTVLDTVCFGECDACTTQLYSFDIKVFLEGPFNGSQMNTSLYDNGIVPDNQPFDKAPWYYYGQETHSAPPDADVVDWVLVEFRQTSGDASTATADKFLDHQAALLLADGSVVKPDGVSQIQYNGDITENLYVLIYHRNHLAVMSSAPMNGLGTVYSYDFTTAQSQAYLDGQKDLGGGYYGMIAGDSDGNNTVVQSDKDDMWNNETGSMGYYGSDLNLDAQVNNQDKNECWEPNLGSSTKVDLPMLCGNPFTDLRDGKAYNTVLIGNQCWMAENLNVGTMIAGGVNQADNGVIEKYCYDDDESNCDVYGGLYQWNEMMDYSVVEASQGICPAGWHVPSDAEWTTLINGFGGLPAAGGSLKETGTVHWNTPNTGATNSSGFTALPGGGNSDDGSGFVLLGENGFFWSSTQNSSAPPVTDSWSYLLEYNSIAITREHNNFNLGISVRCIKD